MKRTGWSVLAFAAGIVIAALVAPGADAHDVDREITRAEAVVVRLSEAGEGPFAFESYEVFRAGEETPAQVGRTDGQGRIIFLPDRAGAWRIRAFSEDGHGVDMTVDVGKMASATPGGGMGTLPGLVAGVGVILGLFGVWSLFWRRAPVRGN